MTNNDLCFIREQYFIDHPNLQKILDSGNTNKQSKRTFICVKVSLGHKSFYLPLRNNLGDAIRKFGRIGHSVPSKNRPNAGIDFRHVLIVDDMKYIEPHTTMKLPSSQYNKIVGDYNLIQKEFEVYLNGFVKAAKKNRITREPLYRDSSLINYVDELTKANIT